MCADVERLGAVAPYIDDGADITSLQDVLRKAVYQSDDLVFFLVMSLVPLVGGS